MSNILTNNINARSGNTITIGKAGDLVSIAGSLSYEDVTSVDSVGVITAQSDVVIADKIIHLGDTDTAIRFPSNNTFSVETGGSERLRVRSNGVVAIGTHESTTINFAAAQTQIFHTGDRLLSLMYGEANTSGPQLNFAKGRDGDNSASTAVNNGDLLGSLHFAGADGSDFNSVGAEIAVNVDGAPGSNDMPGRIVFRTTASGSSTSTDRLRITSGGLVGINVIPTQQKLTIDVDGSGTTQASFDGINICNTDTTTNNGAAIVFGQGIAGNSYARIGVINSDRSGGSEDQHIFFGTLGGGSYAERMRIDSLGRVGINTTGFADSATAINIKNGATGNEHTFVDIECNTNESCRVRFSEDGSTYPGEIRYTTLSHELQFYVNSAQRMFIDNTGRVGVGTDTFNDAAEVMRVQAASGQANTMLTIKSNDNSSGQSILNFGDDDFNEGRIIYQHDDNSMRFRTNDTEHIRIDEGGTTSFYRSTATQQLRVGTLDGSSFGSNENYMIVYGSANDNFTLIRACNTADGTPVFDAEVGGTRRIEIESNGDVHNATGVFTQISDSRFKENIVDSPSQWEDVKALRVRKFNFTEASGYQTHTQIGYVAQEVEQVSPGLTKTRYLYNEDGEEISGSDYKTVKVSLINVKAVKALQEAMDRIETLEAKVAALEGN